MGSTTCDGNLLMNYYFSSFPDQPVLSSDYVRLLKWSFNKLEDSKRYLT